MTRLRSYSSVFTNARPSSSEAWCPWGTTGPWWEGEACSATSMEAFMRGGIGSGPVRIVGTVTIIAWLTGYRERCSIGLGRVTGQTPRSRYHKDGHQDGCDDHAGGG